MYIAQHIARKCPIFCRYLGRLNLISQEQDALKYGRNGLVYEADIPRKDILAYYGRSGKAEVVLDPTNIQNIEVRDESKWSVLSPAHAVQMVENAVKRLWYNFVNYSVIEWPRIPRCI